MGTSDSVGDVVCLVHQLHEAVKTYETADEIELAIANAKLMSGLAPQAAERALCLMRLVALHDRRRILQFDPSTPFACVTGPAHLRMAGGSIS